jgi:hypothetical protein
VDPVVEQLTAEAFFVHELWRWTVKRIENNGDRKVKPAGRFLWTDVYPGLF